MRKQEAQTEAASGLWLEVRTEAASGLWLEVTLTLTHLGCGWKSGLGLDLHFAVWVSGFQIRARVRVRVRVSSLNLLRQDLFVSALIILRCDSFLHLPLKCSKLCILQPWAALHHHTTRGWEMLPLRLYDGTLGMVSQFNSHPKLAFSLELSNQTKP